MVLDWQTGLAYYHKVILFEQVWLNIILYLSAQLTIKGYILRAGLRIAPPEAPVSGCDFGKGVYFADMFSRSVGYCGANSKSPDAVLLLCEVCSSPKDMVVLAVFYQSFWISSSEMLCPRKELILFPSSIQVALGDMNELLTLDCNADKLPKGKLRLFLMFYIIFGFLHWTCIKRRSLLLFYFLCFFFSFLLVLTKI